MKIGLWRIAAALGLTTIGIALLVLLVNSNNAGQRDFIEYWAAGQQLIHGANPYDGAVILQLERSAGFTQEHPQITYSPPMALFLFLPLGLVSANTGLVLWFLAMLASLAASVRMLWKLNGCPANSLHLLSYCFAPVMACIMAGQLGIFLLFCVVFFLYFYKLRPFLAGAVLLICALKPHLFLPFAIALLLWILGHKAYRILAGFFATLLIGCALLLYLDSHIWREYQRMMHATSVLHVWIPTLSVLFRTLINANAIWLEFLPEAGACVWVVWFYWTRKSSWDWMDQGLLVLLISAVCTPYGWFTDEAMLIPAVLAGIYRADKSGRSLLPFGFIAGVAMLEVFAKLSVSSIYFLWTTPAWLGWYLYATRDGRERLDTSRNKASAIVESV
jgi:hypothetical protein